MKVYNYDTNGYYLGECILDDRFKNPMHGAIEGEEEYFIPAQATVVKPLKHKEKHKIKWNGEAWEYEEIPIPEAEEGKEVVWNSEKQEYEQLELPPTFEQMQTNKLIELANAAGQAYINGFVSNASGEDVKFDSTEDDQRTLDIMYAASKSPDFASHLVYQ